MRTAVPAVRVTADALPAEKPFTDAASLDSSVVFASRTVSATCAGTDSTETELSLSVKVVTDPLEVRDQPSGTLTENPAPDGANATKTWSSGISPAGETSLALGSTVAARFASLLPVPLSL